MSPRYDDTHRKWMQISAAEVPGFDARTQCDDAIGKLWALRNHLAEPITDDLRATLDDVDALLDRAIEIGLDPDSDLVSSDGVRYVDYKHRLPEAVRRYAGGKLAASASDVFGECSCGGMWLEELTGPVSHAIEMPVEPSREDLRREVRKPLPYEEPA